MGCFSSWVLVQGGPFSGVSVREFYDDHAVRAEGDWQRVIWGLPLAARAVVDGLLDIDVGLSDKSVFAACTVALGRAHPSRLRKEGVLVRLVQTARDLFFCLWE